MNLFSREAMRLAGALAVICTLLTATAEQSTTTSRIVSAANTFL